MEQISIISNSTGNAIKLFSSSPFRTLMSAVQEKNLMGDDTVRLELVTSDVLNFGKGDYLMLDGDKYSIRTQVTREQISTNSYRYDITLYGVMYELMKCLYRNTDASGSSTKSTFDLTMTLSGFVGVIINNMNRDYPGEWSFDSAGCPVTEAITVNFSNQNCLQVLQRLCKEDCFDTDFRITQSANGVRTIHVGSFGAVVNPPGGGSHFEWGKGKGIYNLKEEKVDDQAVKTRLWVEGGTSNLKADYRGYSDRLQLPYPRRLNLRAHTLRDGTVIAAGSETIGISDDTERYHEDAVLAASIGSDEDYKAYDEIYPRQTGSVTGMVQGDDYSFVDSAMGFDLNDYLISGTSAKITFSSGRLAGQEFELSGYDHTGKRFTVIPYTDERGMTFPTASTGAFYIAVGDGYKITDVTMPDNVVADAEEDLWYASIQDFNDMKQARVKYSLTLDRLYMMRETSGGEVVFKVGDYVPLKDVRFGVEKNIRITKVIRNLLLRQDYSVTISDTKTVSVAAQTVIDVMDHETIIEANRLRDLGRARKAWRTTDELRNMVYDTDGYFDADNIRPNSIDTNMLTVGSKSQQFVLLGVVMSPNAGGNKDRMTISAGTLCHLTIDESGVRNWSMSALTGFYLSDNGGYYVYAKCGKLSGSGGVWLVTQTQYMVENAGDPNNYYFQVGILSSNTQGFRDFVTTYGFTRINGGTITTGKIQTSDGGCYLDLDGNKFRIGDSTSSIDWNVTQDNQLTLKNVVLKSQSGDTTPIGVYRGVYSASTMYYKGDEVSYTNDGETATYRYKHVTSSSGHAPTDSAYWDVIARGFRGEPGVDGEDALQFSLSVTPGYYQKDGNLVDSYIQVGLKEKVDGAMVDRAWNHDNDGWDSYPYKLRWYYVDSNGERVYPASGYMWSVNYVGSGRSGQCIYDVQSGADAWKVLKLNYPSVVIGTDTSSVYGVRLEVVDARLNVYLCHSIGVSKDGAMGDWYEYRYAKNGSATVAPAVSAGERNPGSAWSTTVPSVGSMQYLWMIIAKISGADGSLMQNWSTPVRTTPVDGEDGKSPALLYRGDYDSGKTYYGNANRVDCVKLAGSYYVARIDAGEITGGWDATKWNSFGAQFDSVATNLLLAENANVGGWIFQNGVLKSQKGNVVLDGVNGNVRVAGTVQLSTGFVGSISDVNLFYLPPISVGTTMTMSCDQGDIGKVCRLFNSSPFGGANYTIDLYKFSMYFNPDGSTQSVIQSDVIHALLKPQEVMEVTCFEEDHTRTGYDKIGRWNISGRFGTDQFKRDRATGRFGRVLAIGVIMYNSVSPSSPSINGEYWNGKNISDVLSVSYSDNVYAITASESELPGGCRIFVTPVYNGYANASIYNHVAGRFNIRVNVPCDVQFVIFAPYWSYDLS